MGRGIGRNVGVNSKEVRKGRGRGMIFSRIILVGFTEEMSLKEGVKKVL